MIAMPIAPVHHRLKTRRGVWLIVAATGSASALRMKDGWQRA
ncbi:MAG: hypothetical protein QOI70_1932 [Microbacteriaceae bacterium]|nr:hypothetical protein [Microbacteriaceae bacterium]